MIVDCLTKIIHYKSVKGMIDISDLVEVIINIIVYYHNIPESIITNQNLLLTTKF